VAGRASKCAIAGGVGTESSQTSSGEYELGDVVEPALARALVFAAEAQRWDVVVQIATELQARREARGAVAPPLHGRGKPRASRGRAFTLEGAARARQRSFRTPRTRHVIEATRGSG
jgi:hypothetical protein